MRYQDRDRRSLVAAAAANRSCNDQTGSRKLSLGIQKNKMKTTKKQKPGRRNEYVPFVSRAVLTGRGD